MRHEKAHHAANSADGFAASMMSEIAHMLEQLALSGTGNAIDLRALPMSGADRGELEGMLGRGEIHATLEAAGKSEIRETQYAGVWWICHRGADERIASEIIEVTLVPEILKTPPEDVTGALRRLREDIASHHVNSGQEKSE